MKKQIFLGLIPLNLTSCYTYKPVVDSSGRSGTFPQSQAELITNDTIICTKFAENTLSNSQEFEGWLIDNFFRPLSLGVVSKADDTRKNYIRKCMSNRGHSVLN